MNRSRFEAVVVAGVAIAFFIIAALWVVADVLTQGQPIMNKLVVFGLFLFILHSVINTKGGR